VDGDHHEHTRARADHRRNGIIIAVLRRALLAIAGMVAAACGGNTPPPTPGPPGSGGETISGRERIGWDQQAASATELQAFRYAIYVDNVRSELADVSCGATAGQNGFPCSGRLPSMTNGTHVIELASFIDLQGILESARSAQLSVTVAGAAAPAAGPLMDGDAITTADGVRLTLEVLYEGLQEPSALAIAADGRAFVGTSAGILMIRGGEVLGPAQLTDGRTLAIALSPGFERDGFVFVTQAIAGRQGRNVFRTSRLRDMGGWLAERIVILEHGPASVEPATALRFGPDGTLHLAFDDGDNREAAERMSEWRGKLLRMEPDGRTPRDQAAGSPVVWRGLTSPRGFDWSLNGSAIWIADAARDGVERLRVIVATSQNPRRSAQSASYVLPGGIDASSVTFYRSRVIPAFDGDLFVAGAYLLRIRFDDRGRPMTTERLLEGTPVRGMSVGADGALYFVTDSRVVRLRPL
jgi:glucose/arabinose dehydrogenase